ncbi:MAG: 50S ribosomal protein L20 [Eubacteriales bacterium]|nr:50S ribosomal protein L20 [Eubacteriales bacterium]
MARIKRGVRARARHRKVLKQAKGYFGNKKKLFKVANQQVMKSGQYAYNHRKLKKRDFRRLWITRINAEARNNDLTYSRLINGLKQQNIALDRKVLAEMAVSDKAAFAKLCEQVKA